VPTTTRSDVTYMGDGIHFRLRLEMAVLNLELLPQRRPSSTAAH
jgi:hypothetical protein